MLRPGHVYVAPGDRHMVARAGARRPGASALTTDPPENYCRPAADPMLVAPCAGLYGRDLLAVVLTGMGQDGLRGCQAVTGRGR